MAANFDLSAMALQAVCPNNEILFDDLGMPCIMVKIPKMTYAQLGMGDSNAVHPAFIVNGTEVDAIYIGKYQAIVQNGRAYSLPGVDPRGAIGFDAAREYCEAKGAGWHMMTRMEWGALMRWCVRNNFLPLGNNNYGKNFSETVYKAVPAATNDQGRTTHIATGTGPLSWYHDQTPSGIADLCGNVWEWMGGIRLVNGEIQILANNNGADSARSQGSGSTEWRAINAATGELVAPDGSGTTSGTVKVDYKNATLIYSTTITVREDAARSNTISDMTCDSSIGDAAKLLLQDLGLLPYGSGEFTGQSIYFNNGAAEAMAISGGGYGYSGSGVCSMRSVNKRTDVAGDIGFRCAYVQLPSE